MRELRRRRLELSLGLLWLLDGGLQLQPFMWDRGFFDGIFGMANMGLPGPVARVDYDVSSWVLPHPAVWNACFAGVQVAIGLGLVYAASPHRRWSRRAPIWLRLAQAARMGSVVWALSVWVLGEGIGAMFMGGTSLITGAPGAALLYAVLTVAVWPVPPGSTRAWLAAGATKLSWVAIWCAGALLELVPINHAAGVPGAQIFNGNFGEPYLLAAVDRVVGNGLGSLGLAVSIGVAAVAVFAATAAVPGLDRLRRPALVGAIALAVFVGILGQDVGQILTGQGTDPGTGPLLVLLAVTRWPDRSRSPVASMAPSSRSLQPVRSMLRDLVAGQATAWRSEWVPSTGRGSQTMTSPG